MALFLKILCDLPKQRKFIAAGPIAGWLWLAGLGHCRLSSTDGLIPRAVVPTLVPGLKAPFTHAATLCRVGLWHEVPEGYQVHDYLDMNPSRAQLEEIQKDDAERKRRVREMSKRTSERTPSGVSGRMGQPDASRGRAPASPAGMPAGTPSPSPSPSGPTVVNSEESARETAALAVARPRPTGAIGALGTHHRCPPGTWDACHRGVCVPGQLAQEWASQFDGDGAAAESAIRDCVVTTLAALPPGPIGDEPYPFWRAAWRASHGSSQPAARRGSRTGDTFEQGREFLAELFGKAKP